MEKWAGDLVGNFTINKLDNKRNLIYKQISIADNFCKKLVGSLDYKKLDCDMSKYANKLKECGVNIPETILLNTESGIVISQAIIHGYTLFDLIYLVNSLDSYKQLRKHLSVIIEWESRLYQLAPNYRIDHTLTNYIISTNEENVEITYLVDIFPVLDVEKTFEPSDYYELLMYQVKFNPSLQFATLMSYFIQHSLKAHPQWDLGVFFDFLNQLINEETSKNECTFKLLNVWMKNPLEINTLPEIMVTARLWIICCFLRRKIDLETYHKLISITSLQNLKGKNILEQELYLKNIFKKVGTIYEKESCG